MQKIAFENKKPLNKNISPATFLCLRVISQAKLWREMNGTVIEDVKDIVHDVIYP